MIQPTGHVEVWAPGVRLWHFRGYKLPPLDSKLSIGLIEPHDAITITVIVDAGGASRPDIRVMEDGRQLAEIS